jgi:hypothetical protein
MPTLVPVPDVMLILAIRIGYSQVTYLFCTKTARKLLTGTFSAGDLVAALLVMSSCILGWRLASTRSAISASRKRSIGGPPTSRFSEEEVGAGQVSVGNAFV